MHHQQATINSNNRNAKLKRWVHCQHETKKRQERQRQGERSSTPHPPSLCHDTMRLPVSKARQRGRKKQNARCMYRHRQARPPERLGEPSPHGPFPKDNLASTVKGLLCLNSVRATVAPRDARRGRGQALPLCEERNIAWVAVDKVLQLALEYLFRPKRYSRGGGGGTVKGCVSVQLPRCA